jgi:hypothetical protein
LNIETIDQKIADLQTLKTIQLEEQKLKTEKAQLDKSIKATKPQNRVRYADDFKDGDRTPKQYSYLRSLDKEWLDNRERELGNRISKAEAKRENC